MGKHQKLVFYKSDIAGTTCPGDSITREPLDVEEKPSCVIRGGFPGLQEYDSEKLPPTPACEAHTRPVMKTMTRMAFYILGASAHPDHNDDSRNVVVRA